MKAEITDGELLRDVFHAYFDARRNKRNTINQLEFEIEFEHRLFELAAEIRNRTYKVGQSVCFIVDHPVKREIFAADFKDRVVHHLIYRYINPLFERKLIRDCYSCRKGMGTSDGVERIRHHMRSVTRNFTRPAYVLKLDIQGYFMSIDRQRLYRTVERIVHQGHGKNTQRTELELFLLREVIFADPTENCRVKGSNGDWEGLPPSKSLFHSPEGCGLPIGNLTSQMFSNIYLADFDHYVKRTLGIEHYGRYVDDFYFMHPSRQRLVEVRDAVDRYLRENHGLIVHPKKIYLQDVRHGVTFLGAHVKPYRAYAKSKTLGQIRNNIRRIDRSLIAPHTEEPSPQRKEKARSVVNSYLGYLGQFKTHGIRREIWCDAKQLRRHFRIDAATLKISPRKIRAISAQTAPPDLRGLFPED